MLKYYHSFQTDNLQKRGKYKNNRLLTKLYLRSVRLRLEWFCLKNKKPPGKQKQMNDQSPIP
ncbi:hypothetical protein HNP69_000682 [Chryseobacterium koreense]|nr:hypothetical protein [Chryseobacterium koreense]